MEMTADGRPTQVLLRPPAPVAVCLRWIVRESSFPRPPAPGYWVSVDLSATRAPGAPVDSDARRRDGDRSADARRPPRPPPPPKSPPPDADAVRERAISDPRAVRGSLAGRSERWRRPGRAPPSSVGRPSSRSVRNLPGRASPRYRVALGDPLKLESVLLRHPTLRVVVSGAGWPFGDAMVGLMRRYPQVSVDIRPLTQALPDAEVQAYVRRLADAGLGERILK